MEQLLRAFILKISVCDAVLNNNPPGNLTNNYRNIYVSIQVYTENMHLKTKKKKKVAIDGWKENYHLVWLIANMNILNA